MTAQIIEKPRRSARIRREFEFSDESHFIELENVSWALYEKLLRETQGQHVRVTYDNGRLVLMAFISIDHELPKGFLGRIVETLTEELNIPICGRGSVTWRRKDLAQGLESDECCFIQHAAHMRKVRVWNPRRDPPPDLVIEVDITHHPIDCPAIYAALGVSELWRCDGKRVEFQKLGTDKRYHPVEASPALPMLTSGDVNRYLAMLDKLDETTIIRSFRKWVAKQGNR